MLVVHSSDKTIDLFHVHKVQYSNHLNNQETINIIRVMNSGNLSI